MTDLTMKNRYFLVFSIGLMAFIFNADYLAINLAIQPIIEEFHSKLETIQWILSGYMLIWSLFVIPAGKLLELHSTKRIAIIGTVLFLLASMFAGLAFNAWSIILARMLQGASAAIFLPAGFAMMFNHFQENERGKVMGLISLAVGIGLALGPVLGGALMTWSHWRSVFFINIPIGFIVVAIIALCDKTPRSTVASEQKLSKTSMFLLSCALPGFLFLLSQHADWHRHVFFYFALFSLSLFTFILFVRQQQKISNPLIPSSLFQNKGVVGCCLGIFAMEYAFSTIVIIMGLYLQKEAALSFLDSSVSFLSMTTLFGIIAVFSGRWTDRHGIRLPVVLGLIILMASSFLFPWSVEYGPLYGVHILFMLMGIGAGLSFAALNAGILKTASANQVGIASSLFLMITLVGNAIGVAASTSIYLSYGINMPMYINGLLCSIFALLCAQFIKKRSERSLSDNRMSK